MGCPQHTILFLPESRVLTLLPALQLHGQVKMTPGSGYLSVEPGAMVKVLYIGSADEEGCLHKTTLWS